MRSEPDPESLDIRPAAPADTEEWLKMRLELWPEGSESEHRFEIERFFRTGQGEPEAVILACDRSGAILGFVELSIRRCAEGCVTDRVAYLEGWYVKSNSRGRGVGRALILAAEDWGRSQGCVEFASDTWADNQVSRMAHRALGFEEAGLVRCFRKSL